MLVSRQHIRALLITLCCACFAISNATGQRKDCDSCQHSQQGLQKSCKAVAVAKVALFGRVLLRPSATNLPLHDCRIALQAQIVNLGSPNQTSGMAKLTSMVLPIQPSATIPDQLNQSSTRYALLLDCPRFGKRMYAKPMVLVHAELACQDFSYTLQGVWAVELLGRAARLNIDTGDMSVTATSHDRHVWGNDDRQTGQPAYVPALEKTSAMQQATSKSVNVSVWPRQHCEDSGSIHSLTSSSCYVAEQPIADWRDDSTNFSSSTKPFDARISHKNLQSFGLLQSARQAIMKDLLCMPAGVFTNLLGPALSMIIKYVNDDTICIPWVMVSVGCGIGTALATLLICALAYTVTARSSTQSNVEQQDPSYAKVSDSAFGSKRAGASGPGRTAMQIMRMSGSIAASAIARASGGIQQAAINAGFKWSRDDDGRLKRFSGAALEGQS